MNRYRTVPGLNSQQRANASTTCQKCLKRGHFSYECKVTNAERPYISRPSRTQQLLNPNLAPKLSSDVPNDLLRKYVSRGFDIRNFANHGCRKGVADEEIAKQERGRAAERADSPPEIISKSRKRSRSDSSDSMDSVSTISTNRSVSPKRARRGSGDYVMSQQAALSFQSPPHANRKRRRRSTSSGSGPSSLVSPPRSGRDGHGRRRHRTVSPDSRGRPSSERRGSRRDRSTSGSVDKSRVARARRSMTPQVSTSHGTDSKENQRPGRFDDQERRSHSGTNRPVAPRRPPHKDGSLSPYSRRLALTQSMNMG